MTDPKKDPDFLRIDEDAPPLAPDDMPRIDAFVDMEEFVPLPDTGDLAAPPVELDVADEGSWLDDGRESGGPPVTLDADDARWTDDDSRPALEGDWFDDDGELPPDDGGKEGPLVDDIRIEEDWPDLPGMEDDRDDDRDDVQFLGPMLARVHAVVLTDRGPVAVGDGLFLPGPDGILQRVPLRPAFEATAAVVFRDTLYLRGVKQGLWAWPLDGDSPRVTTVFHPATDEARPVGTTHGSLCCHRTPDGPHLLYLDDAGRLHRSVDGATFDELFPSLRFMAVSEGPGTSAPLVLLTAPPSGPALFTSRDLATLTPLAVFNPPPSSKEEPPPCIRAAFDTVAIAHAGGLDVSVDRGSTFLKVVRQPVHAVAISSADPAALVCGVFHPLSRRTTIRHSEDGGRTFTDLFSLDGPVLSIWWERNTGYVLQPLGLYRFSIPGRRATH